MSRPSPLARRLDRVGDAVALAGVVLTALVLPTAARACPYSIRDAAFLAAAQPRPFTLYVACDGAGTTAEQRAQIAGWLDAAGPEWLAPARVIVRVVAVTGERRAELDANVAAVIARGELPAAMLVSPDGATLTIARGAALQLDQPGVRRLVERAVSSPLRERLRELLTSAWCVSLLVEGRNADANAAARGAFEEAARAILGRETELGKTISRGPELLIVPASGEAREVERALLWSQGLDGPASEPRMVLLTGRGERRAEVLRGGEIKTARLLEWFEMLGRSCSCTTSPSWLSGPSVLLRWGPREKSAAQRSLGFDPDDPEVIGSIRSAAGGGEVIFEDVGLGYSEISLGPLVTEETTVGSGGATSRDDPATTPTAKPIATSSSVSPAPESATPATTPATGKTAPDSRAGRASLYTLAALMAVAMALLAAVTVWVLRRSRASTS